MLASFLCLLILIYIYIYIHITYELLAYNSYMLIYIYINKHIYIIYIYKNKHTQSCPKTNTSHFVLFANNVRGGCSGYSSKS